MRQHFWIPLLGLAFLPGLALADEWKDESGHGRHHRDRGWGEHRGEPPAWARGRGYWDGHHRTHHPPGYWGEADRPWGGYFAPPGYWDEDDFKDWRKEREERLKDRRERLKDLREEERERYEDWLEDRRERLEDLRERQWRDDRYWR